ncbi:polyprenyl synthetase family protein [Brevundimonas sp. MF30-B]|uniref:polyprenyl synthetase family protein n=2 Tax=unclassified Brevundimonas TaxID=2622653 RepID=UPI0010761978|nr:polyprenyl synthetase family protein [Brevundimonas sp. MF30-B]
MPYAGSTIAVRPNVAMARRGRIAACEGASQPMASAVSPSAFSGPILTVSSATSWLATIDRRLGQLIPEPDGAGDILPHVVRSALCGPGKRVRPVMAMMACEHVGGDPADALDFGCAVEMMHASSLVLDDLPCMDDASLRRGAPALHRAHGEDAAVLASIALLNQAFATILRAPDIRADQRLALLDALTSAVGFQGLAHGQMRDLRDPAEARDEPGLRRLNHLKTTALFLAALKGGAEIGDASPEQEAALIAFGEIMGFAFQLCDDLQDRTAAAEDIGKDVGQDRDQRTFLDLWGVDEVRTRIRDAAAQAETALGGPCALADYAAGLVRSAYVEL